MLKLEKPSWQFSVLRAAFVIIALPTAVGVALIAWRLSVWRLIHPVLGFAFFIMTFVVFSVVLYSVWAWLFVNRPEELAEKIPPTSKQLRRRRKEYFKNLLR